MMFVETPGGRVTRRPRGVSGERERGARVPRASARRARAREPVVTYRARDRSPHPPRSRAERAVGR